MSLAGMNEIALAVTVVKTLLLVVGGVIASLAFKAYRRTGQRALGYLTLGFAIVTIGFVLAGTVYEILGISLALGVLLESVLVLVGFSVIAYSLAVQ